MPDEDIFANISVFRYRDGHIIVHDPFYPLGNPHNQYFDFHDVTLRFLDQEEMKNLSEISGEQKEKACQIYLHWKFREACDYVKRKAAEYFPLTGSIPDVNEWATISRKREPEQLEIRVSARRREEAIREICNRQNIQQLAHFTHIDNLSNILRLGLVGRDKVRKSLNPVTFKINDELRIDGHPEAVCLSISFPNYRMFYPYNQKSPADWVVISLRSEILWELDCAFCRENAASNNVRFVPIDIRRQVNALEDLFRDVDQVKRSDLNIPASFPTNPQAEVLVFNRIHPRYIMKVYFYDHQARDYWFKKNPFVAPDLLMVEREYFSPRCDYRFWQNQMNGRENYIECFEDIPF